MIKSVGGIGFNIVLNGSRQAISGVKNIEKGVLRIGKAGKEVNKTFNSLVRLLGFAGATHMVLETAKMGRSMELLSDQTGIASSELSKLRTAFGAAGVSGQRLDGILQRLNKEIQDTTLGKGSGLLAGMGINIRDRNGKLKTPDEVLKEVATYAQNKVKMGKSTQTVSNLLASSLGIDQQMANILMQGPEALDELVGRSSERFGNLSVQQVKNLSELQKSVDEMKTSSVNLAQSVMADLAPELKNMASVVVDILGILREKFGIKPVDTDKERLEAIARGIAQKRLPMEQLVMAAKREGVQDVETGLGKIKFKMSDGKSVEFNMDEISTEGKNIWDNPKRALRYTPTGAVLGMISDRSNMFVSSSRYSDFEKQFKGGTKHQKELYRLRDALLSGAYTEDDVDKAHNLGMITFEEAQSYRNVLNGNFAEPYFSGYAKEDAYARAVFQSDNSPDSTIILNSNTNVTLNPDGTIESSETSLESSEGSAVKMGLYNNVNAVKVN